MDKQTEALKMAIEALDDIELCDYQTQQKAIKACKEALEQHEKLHKVKPNEQPAQEPVAWECFSDPAYYDMWAIRQIGNRNFEETIHVVNGKEAKQLCAWLNSLKRHPAPSWQGLSDDEIKFLCDVVIEIESNDVIEYEWHEIEKIARAIEAKLKEKNGR